MLKITFQHKAVLGLQYEDQNRARKNSYRNAVVRVLYSNRNSRNVERRARCQAHKLQRCKPTVSSALLLAVRLHNTNSNEALHGLFTRMLSKVGHSISAL